MPSRQLTVKLDTLKTCRRRRRQEPAPRPRRTTAPQPGAVERRSYAGAELRLAGVLIQDIDPNSVAASKGFAVGDTILEVDNKAVTTPKAFQSAIDAVKASGRSTALIKAERDGQSPVHRLAAQRQVTKQTRPRRFNAPGPCLFMDGTIGIWGSGHEDPAD